jgi:hypothetical protein
MAISGHKSKRFWRGVIGIIVSYAVALQTLFIGFAGSAQAADKGLSAFELCHGLNGVQNTSDSPSGQLGHVVGNHCIFCYAGSNLAVDTSPPRLCHLLNVQVQTVRWPFYIRHLSSSDNYSIAQPRGPPPSA